MKFQKLFALTITLLSFAGPMNLFSQTPADTDSIPIKTVPPPQPRNTELLFQGDEYFFEEKFQAFSLRSPYHAFLSHLNYLDPENFHPDSAAIVLNFRNPRSDKAKDYALKLKEIFEARGLTLDPEELPRDPDYKDSVTGRHTFRPFPKLNDIYLVKVANRWVYSRFTVQDIPRLHKLSFPLGTIDWVPEWSKENIGGLELWQWIGIALYIFAMWLLHKIVTFTGSLVLRSVFRGISRETIAYKFFHNAARPFSFLVISALLIWFLPMLHLPAEVNKYLIIILKIFIPAFIVMMVYFVVDVLMAFALKGAEKTPSDLDDNLMPMLRKLIKGLVILVGFLMILSNLDVNITAVLAGLSIGGIAVALAAQDTVKNLFGSLMIYIDRPFKVGDWVIVGDIEGTVEEIGVRSTRIRSFADSLIYVPNGRLADSNVNNMGLRVYRRLITTIGIDYETPNELIEVFTNAITEIVMSHPDTRKEETFINLHELGPYSMNIRIIMYFSVKDTETESAYRQQMLLAILRLADRIGIKIAVPRQLLQVEKFPGQDESKAKPYLTPAEAKEKAETFTNELKKGFN